MHTHEHLPVNLPTYPHQSLPSDFLPLQVCSLRFIWSTLKHGNGSFCDSSGGYHASWGTHLLQNTVCGCEWSVQGNICYMASGFPPIAVTDIWLHSFPTPHILSMALCDMIYCQWFQYHTNITGPHAPD